MLDFVVVGPMKTGTSWVHEFLSWHSQVRVPTTVKETFFFTANNNKGEQWLLNQFGNYDDESVKGEVGPTYFAKPDAARLIRENSPDAKIIIILREPYERFLSHYHHNVRIGNIEPGTPLDKAYNENDNMRGQSDYYNNIVLWKQTFGADQVIVLFQEDLDKRPQQFVSDLSDALGIEIHDLPEKLNKKVGHGGVPVNKSLVRIALKINKFLRNSEMNFIANAVKKLGIREMLYKKNESVVTQIEGSQVIRSIFLADIIRVEKELEVDLSHWKYSDKTSP